MVVGANSSWFGSFIAYPQGWIYHAILVGSILHSDSSTSLWLWSSDNGWQWTGSGIYPHLFQNSSANWLYFIKNKDGKPYYYDYATVSQISTFFLLQGGLTKVFF